MMRKERELYDPKIYGELRARFLNDLAGLVQTPYAIQENEKRKLIRDIREGKLAPTKPEAAI